MSVPNHFYVIEQLHATGLYNLSTEHGQAAFIDAVFPTLHYLDERWGILKKNPSQTNIHGHGEDSALYLSDVDGQSTAVDFIANAGLPSARPAWQVDTPRYSKKDWADPNDHGFKASAPPAPSVKVLPKGEAFVVLTALNTFYASPEGLQRPGGMIRYDNEGRSIVDTEAVAQWFYQMAIEGVTLADVFAQIRSSQEWRTKHGL